MPLVAELFGTLENELSNRSDWTFDGQQVRVACASDDGEELYVELMDDRRVTLQARVFDPRPRFHVRQDILAHAGHKLHFDEKHWQLWCGNCSVVLGSLENLHEG